MHSHALTPQLIKLNLYALAYNQVMPLPGILKTLGKFITEDQHELSMTMMASLNDMPLFDSFVLWELKTFPQPSKIYSPMV